MTFCKHEKYKVINDIWAPKWSTSQVLISANKVSEKVDHYLIKFTKAPSIKGWLYITRKDIIRGGKQKNGTGWVYTPHLDWFEDFTPLKTCEHTD